MEPPSNGELSFLATNGERTTWSVHFGTDTTTDEAGLPARLLTADDGRALALQKWVPASLPPRLPAAYDLLENEIRAGMRLLRRYGTSYPVEMARLVGYDADAEQPFLLVTQPRGEPLTAVAGQLLLAEQRAFETSLFRALLLLDEADLVHGNLTPRTVRWDRNRGTVQVRDFGHSAVRDEPRRPHDVGVWTPAEQRHGTGAAVPADDIWAGGMLLYHVITGRQPSVRNGPPNLADRSAALRTALDGVFAESADDRPDAAEILQRMRADATVSARPAGADSAFEEGGRRFDEVRRSKWPTRDRTPADSVAEEGGRRSERARRSTQPPPGSTDPPPPPPAEPRPRRGRGLWLAVTLATVMVVAAVAVLYTQLGGR